MNPHLFYPLYRFYQKRTSFGTCQKERIERLMYHQYHHLMSDQRTMHCHHRRLTPWTGGWLQLIHYERRNCRIHRLVRLTTEATTTRKDLFSSPNPVYPTFRYTSTYAILFLSVLRTPNYGGLSMNVPSVCVSIRLGPTLFGVPIHYASMSFMKLVLNNG